MPEISIDQEPSLDILTKRGPALSATSDMPMVETKPDSPAPPDPEKPATEPVESKAVPPAEDAGEAEQTDESATSDTDEQTGHSGDKVPRGVGKRLAELTKRADEAERRAAQEREERLKLYEHLMRNQTAAEAEAHAAEDVAPVKPNKADFADDDEWDAAMLDYSEQRAQHIARQEIRETIERERQQAERRAIEQAQQQERERHQERIAAAAEKYPDFHEVAENPDVQVSMVMAHAILQSDSGPDIQYYLGANPAEAKRIMALTPPRQLVELGKIEAKLTAPKPEAAPAPKPRISNAPPPIRPLKSGDVEPVAKNRGEMSMDEYIATRRKEQSAARR